MESLLFLVLFFGIVCIVWTVSKQSDGFQDITPPGASPGLNSPVISPRAQTLTQGDVKPFADPTTALLGPPPGQTASVNSLPAEDPAMQKADARRMYSVYESLKGFFMNDAKHLQELGDATIQLPLATAKSDAARLRDELAAIDRNPGLQSTLTQDDVNGIEANLAYLEHKWRMSANAMGAASPMPPFEEGFQSRGGGWYSWFFGGAQEGFQVALTIPTDTYYERGAYATQRNDAMRIVMTLGSTSATITGKLGDGRPSGYANQGLTLVPVTATSFTVTWPAPNTAWGVSGVSTFVRQSDGSLLENDSILWVTSSWIPSPGSGSKCTAGSSCIATIADLQNLSTNIVAETVRLQASGAQDSTTQNRIKLLTSILQSVNDMVTGLQNGTIKSTDIKLTQGQINTFLKNIKNPNSPLTTLLSDWGLPSGLANLFPTYAAGDVSGADLAKDLFGKYIKDIQNLSWDISLNYKGKAEQDIAYNYASAMKDARYFIDNTGAPVASNSDAGGSTSASASAYRGLFDSVITGVTGQSPTVNAAVGPTTPSGGSSASPYSPSIAQPFDWKSRSSQICSQIKLRGMEPYNFGCLPNPDSVRQENFSWRGYTKMICTRLSTMYDPSIPELCGCPPPAWNGWRP